MATQDFRNVPVKPEMKDRLDKFRKGQGIGKVTYGDAIGALLDFWEDKHK